jgi:multidrug efflux pump subunit AcrB
VTESGSLGISGRIAQGFGRNALTPLLALVLLLLGVFATLITPKEEEPQIDVTMANVLVPWPGASARAVEAIVARPAEQVLSRNAGVDHVYSVSRPGMAVLTVQFEVGVPNQDALVKLYDTLDSHRDWLSPELGVLEPVVKPKKQRLFFLTIINVDDIPHLFRSGVR